jgi:sigma-B regulation protein RsbU (phosphoserine phosphatase)
MKFKDIIASKSTRTAILLVVVAAVTLEATSLLQGVFSRRTLQAEMSMRAEGRLNLLKSEIMNVINQAEAAVRNKVWIAQWSLDNPDSLGSVGRMLVRDNPVIVGSTVALVPGYDRKHPLLSPYTFRSGDSLVTRSLATEAYDYPSKEWFTKPLELKEGYWSEPYVDEGGGDMLMTTYSVPIFDEKGNSAAVLTGDISLDWLTDLVSTIKVYPHSRSIMLSRNGLFMVSPREEVVMTKTVDEVVGQMKDSLAFKALNQAMLEGRSGEATVLITKEKHHVYYAPVERTGWSMCIIIPDGDIYSGMRKTDLMTRLLEILGLIMLIILLRASVRSQLKNTELRQRKERMEGELRVASRIQMSMVPDPGKSFPERDDLDMAASIIPAKEVGGDLYDFFIRNERLYFCIGDVSGKGIPASLVMAVTRTAFRTVSAREDSPALIVRSINDGMAEMNEDNLFVTFFCGVLSLDTGHLCYCNAGHNPPRALTDRIFDIPTEPNLPLGIVSGYPFVEQELDLQYDDALFLYTDGLTEAENSRQELFGEARMEAALHGRKSAVDHLKNMQKQVAEFVGDAPQSDDLTMLFLHYLGKKMGYHLTLFNDVRQISLLAGFMERIRVENNLNPGLATKINLALEEAVTNVVMYAYPKGTKEKINLEAVRDGNTLRFTLTDRGRVFDPTAAPKANISASLKDRPIGGLGIHLVRTIMDSVTYRRAEGKNVLTMTINI